MSNMTSTRIYFDKIYALWLREVKVFFREKSRLVASTFTPLLWLFVIGTGFGSSTPVATHSIDYQKFIFPGIICMSFFLQYFLEPTLYGTENLIF